MNPLVSIIVPTYNSEATVRKALESILSQCFQQYEVLFIDALSTDHTAIIVASSASKDARIMWAAEKDNGIYDAMNKGITLAKGEWLLFLGSDDYLHDDKVLKDVATVLESSDADVVYGDAILMSDGQRYGGEFDLVRLHTVQNLCHQTAFYRKLIFDKLGKYNLRYKIAADWDFNIRCFRHPDIKMLHITRDIVIFNNLTGVSSLPHDDPFYQEISVRYIQSLAAAKLENEELLKSRSYLIGKRIYKFLKLTGVISFVNKFRKV